MKIEELWKKFKDGDTEARRQIILNYLHLVKYTVSRLAINFPPHLEVNDLISSGIIGLIDAIEKFELDRQVKFETYASIRIRGAVLDSLRSMDWAPRGVRRKARELEEVYAALEKELGRTPSEEEVATRMGIPLQDLHKQLSEVSGVALISLDDFYPTEGEKVLVKDGLKDDAEGPEELAIKSHMKQLLVEAIERLPEKEKIVLSLHYYEELTLKEISKVLSLSEARISQLHSQAVLRLKGKLHHLVTA